MKYKQSNGKPAIKLHTVNVVEVVNEMPISLRSFVDNPLGNERAEALFKKLIKEHNSDRIKFSEDDFDDMIEDGVYDGDCGYILYLIHST